MKYASKPISHALFLVIWVLCVGALAAKLGDEVGYEDMMSAVYWHGQRNYAETKKHIEKAIALGNTTALYVLGGFYEGGTVYPHDFQEAAKWIKKAIEKNVVGAECKLGQLYEKGGPGLPQDYKEAMKWYEIGVKKSGKTKEKCEKRIQDLKKVMGK